jgi:tRNA nucleotidyltransferase/poly(A) polymerase
LGFSIETATREAMTKHAPALLRCAPARLQEELLRLLTSGYAQGAMTLADNCGVLQAIVPELVAVMNEPMVVEALPPPEPIAAPVNDAGEPIVADGEQPSEQRTEPVAAMPLIQPATPDERWMQLSALLGAMDATRARDVEVSAAVVLATLLTPVAKALHVAGRSFDGWYGATCDQWTQRWRLTRHDRERVQSILQMQPDLHPHRRRGQAAKQTVSRPWFREALLMDILQRIADNEPLDEVNSWKVVAQHAGAQYQQAKAMPHGVRAPRERTEFRGGGRGGDRDRGGGRGRGRGGDRGRRRG